MKRRSVAHKLVFMALSAFALVSARVSPLVFGQDQHLGTGVHDFDITRSTSRRFVVTGADAMARMDIANWADRIAGRIERTIGAKLPSHPDRIIRIVIGSLDTEQESKERKAVVFVRSYVSIRGSEPVQSLVISDYQNVSLEEARNELCRLILNSYVMDRQMGKEGLKALGGTVQEAVAALHSVPYWFSIGISQNLYPKVRARNNDEVSRLRKEGGLPSVSRILSSEREDDSVCGVLVDWITSLPGRSERCEKILGRVASGEAVSPEWIVGHIPDCESAEDLENKWNSWISRQKWVVNVPGVATPAVLEHLQSQLLLCPGDSGIPLEAEGSIEEGAGLNELIALRGQPWIKVFCRAKTASLRLAAAGRGEELGAVVELYCGFLGDLAAGRKETQLKKSLDKADRALEELADELAGTDFDREGK